MPRKIVQRAAERRLDRAQIEWVYVMVEAVEHVGAQRVERQVERHLEISRQMRAGDLVAVERARSSTRLWLKPSSLRRACSGER